jgi:hypothetical protein
VAQTKKKRQTKHRGNAAGVIEVRGRTGRPPSPEEKKAQRREEARMQRQLRPPSWKVATRNSAGIGVLMFLVLLFENRSKGNAVPSALLIAALAFVVYVPLGYYLERMMWKRRMDKAAATGSTRGR